MWIMKYKINLKKNNFLNGEKNVDKKNKIK